MPFDVEEMYVGHAHTCARGFVAGDGTYKSACWGSNRYLQLTMHSQAGCTTGPQVVGSVTYTATVCPPIPTPAAGLLDPSTTPTAYSFATLALGKFHTCGLHATNATVICAGHDGYGSTGHSTQLSQSALDGVVFGQTPVLVSIPNLAMVSMDRFNLKAGGFRTWAWFNPNGDHYIWGLDTTREDHGAVGMTSIVPTPLFVDWVYEYPNVRPPSPPPPPPSTFFLTYFL